jgi:hypothetical protein
MTRILQMSADKNAIESLTKIRVNPQNLLHLRSIKKSKK